jgi:hypothetical protein
MKRPVSPNQIARFQALRKFVPDLRNVPSAEFDEPTPGFIYPVNETDKFPLWIAIDPKSGTFFPGDEFAIGKYNAADLNDCESAVIAFISDEQGAEFPPVPAPESDCLVWPIVEYFDTSSDASVFENRCFNAKLTNRTAADIKYENGKWAARFETPCPKQCAAIAHAVRHPVFSV